MIPRSEDDIDRDIALKLEEFKPVLDPAFKKQYTREQASQILVNYELERNQLKSQPVVPIQKHPGEYPTVPEKKIEEAVISTPEKMAKPVGGKTIPFRLVSKKQSPTTDVYALSNQNAFGLPIEEQKVGSTPVTRLNLLDQFFNWINRLFPVE